MRIITKYKAELRRQIDEGFPFAFGVGPVAFTLATSPPTHLLRRGIFTLGELARAECFRPDSGEYMRFVDTHGIRLSHSFTFGFDDDDDDDAPEVVVISKAQALDRPTSLLYVGIQTPHGLCVSAPQAGVFVFQLCWEHDLPSSSFFLDARLWSSVTLTLLLEVDLRTLGLSKHEAATRSFGFNDTGISPGFGGGDDLENLKSLACLEVFSGTAFPLPSRWRRIWI